MVPLKWNYSYGLKFQQLFYQKPFSEAMALIYSNYGVGLPIPDNRIQNLIQNFQIQILRFFSSHFRQFSTF